MMHIQKNTGGFTLLGLIILIAIIGIVSAATLHLGAIAQRRVSEEQLLDTGAAFITAFDSYAKMTPAGHPRSPAALEDLLKDSRFPNVVRHLRKIYVDPMTGKDEWGIIPAPGGKGIMGVYSLSEGRPIKIDNFDPPFQDFASKTSYRDWKFVFVPSQLQTQPKQQPKQTQ